MNDKQDNPLHDDHLSNIYQQSRVDEPPMALDSAILTQARKAVATPEKKSMWNRMGWKMPLASVAVAMLTVSLIIQTKQEHPEVMAPELMIDVAPMLERGIAPEEDDGVFNRSEERESAKDIIEKKSVAAPKAKQTHASPAPSAPAQAAKRMMKMESRPATMQQFQATPAPVQSEPITSDMMDAETGYLGTVQIKSKAVIELSIEEWLKKIRKLIKDGKIDEARKSQVAFNKAHPDYSLPEDIVSGLKE